MPKCGKCDYNVFVCMPVSLVGASPKAKLVCCGKCYTVVGVLDSEDINSKLDHVISALNNITTKIDRIIKI